VSPRIEMAGSLSRDPADRDRTRKGTFQSVADPSVLPIRCRSNR